MCRCMCAGVCACDHVCTYVSCVCMEAHVCMCNVLAGVCACDHVYTHVYCVCMEAYVCMCMVCGQEFVHVRNVPMSSCVHMRGLCQCTHVDGCTRACVPIHVYPCTCLWCGLCACLCLASTLAVLHCRAVLLHRAPREIFLESKSNHVKSH